jgi:membrane-bound hydrogenase subunit beta
MEETLAVQADLMKRFARAVTNVRVPRARRIFAEVALADRAGVFDTLVRELGFSILLTITGLDLGEKLGVIYHLARPSGVVLNLSTVLPKPEPVLPSVTSYFPAAELYERELFDLLGIKVQGLPEGPRYPLPDDWPDGQFPLRKDWDPKSLQQGPAGPSEVHNA